MFKLFLRDTVRFFIQNIRKCRRDNKVKIKTRTTASDAYAVEKIRQLTDIETTRLTYCVYCRYGILMWSSAANIDNIVIFKMRHSGDL